MPSNELVAAKTEFAEIAVDNIFYPESFLEDAGSDVSVDTQLTALHDALGKLKALDRADKPFDVEYDALLAFTILRRFHAAAAGVLQQDKEYAASIANSDGPNSNDWKKSLEPDDASEGSRKFTSDPSVRDADRKIHRDATTGDEAVAESLRKGLEEKRDEAEKERSGGSKGEDSEKLGEKQSRSREVNIPKTPKKFGSLASPKIRYEKAIQYAARLVVAAVRGKPVKEGPRLAPLVDTLQVAVWGEIDKLCSETLKIADALRYPEESGDFDDED